jgi:hypothetical protein
MDTVTQLTISVEDSDVLEIREDGKDRLLTTVNSIIGGYQYLR